MRNTDIAIVGGGLAGATAAAMLGGAGISALVIDPDSPYPPDFRCEKLDTSQMRLLEEIGLAEMVLRKASLFDELWIARLGHVVCKRPNEQYGIAYGTLVNLMRAQVGGSAEFLCGKVASIVSGDDRQTLTLSSGEEISARLVVLASGLNNALRHSLGIERKEISRHHSVTAGFDVRSLSRDGFTFPALTYFGERIGDRVAYLTLFPIGGAIRANLFMYRDPRDPWLKTLRDSPREALLALQPRLRHLLGEFEIDGPVQVRPVDLYRVQGYLRAGIVLVGDAFATSCPAAGTGLNKAFTDVLRLCGVYIPRWLASPGMGVEKISAFYGDAVKADMDAHSEERAYYLRSLTIDPNISWSARRMVKFLAQWGMGVMHQVRVSAKRKSPAGPHASAGSSLGS